MRKLSEAQIKAIEYVQAYGNELNPQVRENTWASLVKAGLITRGHEVAVTILGREAYEYTTGALLDGIQEQERTPDILPPVDPAVLLIDEIDQRKGTSITSDGAQAAQEAPSVLTPVFQEPRPNTIYGQRPVQAVQADRDHLVRTYGETRADEILDTWETVANRDDRRNGQRKARAEGRREMRLRRTPSRRRFTTQAALIRKAERRAAKIQAA